MPLLAWLRVGFLLALAALALRHNGDLALLRSTWDISGARSENDDRDNDNNE